MVPQRFAIDFYLLDAEHRAWVGDPSKLTSHLAYQKPIFAAVGGTVVAAQDGLPNNPSLRSRRRSRASPTPWATRHPADRADRYLLYAHMDTGSVKVEIGQRVEKGQELGLIGTSGNSTIPHVHFQVLTRPSFFPSDSTPFVFESFELTGRITQRIWDDTLGLQPTGALPFEAANPGGTRTKRCRSIGPWCACREGS